eukprot:5784815-Karenia_brevis.AAC.1
MDAFDWEAVVRVRCQHPSLTAIGAILEIDAEGFGVADESGYRLLCLPDDHIPLEIMRLSSPPTGKHIPTSPD